MGEPRQVPDAKCNFTHTCIARNRRRKNPRTPTPAAAPPPPPQTPRLDDVKSEIPLAIPTSENKLFCYLSKKNRGPAIGAMGGSPTICAGHPAGADAHLKVGTGKSVTSRGVPILERKDNTNGKQRNSLKKCAALLFAAMLGGPGARKNSLCEPSKFHRNIISLGTFLALTQRLQTRTPGGPTKSGVPLPRNLYTFFSSTGYIKTPPATVFFSSYSITSPQSYLDPKEHPKPPCLCLRLPDYT